MPGGGLIHCRVTRLARASVEHPEILERAQELMAHATKDWADRNGYEILRVSWELIEPEEPELAPDPLKVVPSWLSDLYTLRMEATCRPRWDGVWGDLRRALHEDGLLPSTDGSPPTGRPSAPAVGDIWVGVDPAVASSGVATVMMWNGWSWVVVSHLADPPFPEVDRLMVAVPDPTGGIRSVTIGTRPWRILSA